MSKVMAKIEYEITSLLSTHGALTEAELIAKSGLHLPSKFGWPIALSNLMRGQKIEKVDSDKFQLIRRS